MPEFVEQPVIMSIQAEVKDSAKSAFIDWQADFNARAANAPGFVSLEFSLPTPAKKCWQVVVRFTDKAAAEAWKQTNAYSGLISTLKALTINGEVTEEDQGAAASGGSITEVIVASVSPGHEKRFRDWSARIHQIEAKFPGFRGVYMQSPTNRQSCQWITLLQFDNMENLDRWLQSPERQLLLRESGPLLTSLESHRVISPFAGWFASIAHTGELPAAWKQNMLVLLVLFPIVMLELKFLSPLTAPLNSALGVFIGNTISVWLISFPCMPVVIKLLGWWLPKNEKPLTLLGIAILLALYAAEIAFFWRFF